MAVDFHNRKTLLPSKLLTEDDILTENQNISPRYNGVSIESIPNVWSSLGTNKYSGLSIESIPNVWGSLGSSSSGLSTPAGSEFDSSTETESDDYEDDFIAELTRQMAENMLQEDDENAAPNNKPSGKLSDFNSGSENHHGQRLIGTPPNTTSVSANAKHLNIGFYSNQTFFDDQIPPVQFYEVKNQPLVEHQGSASWGGPEKLTESTQQLEHDTQLGHEKHHHHVQNTGRACGLGNVNGGMFGPLGSAQAGWGMRVVFLGGSRSRSESCGTGVFLPSPGATNSTEPRKKSGCSTVLIPERVLKALELHFKNMDALSQSNNCGGSTASPTLHDVAMAKRDDLYSQQRRRSQSQRRRTMNHEETHLPEEWTY